MATVTININDAVFPDVRTSILEQAGYDAGQISTMTVAQRNENARLYLVNHVKAIYREWKLRNNPDTDVT